MILDYPKIYEDDVLVGHGGNQSWFEDKWARKAGCASVSATDIYSFYKQQDSSFTKKEYLGYMNEMFKLLEPGKQGFPYVYLYARRLRVLLDDCPTHIYRKPSIKLASEVIIQSIDKGNPLGLLILTHRRRKIRDDLWHWVTIVGYKRKRKGIDVVYLDCGKLKEIPARIIFEKSRFNVVKMVCFYKKKA